MWEKLTRGMYVCYKSIQMQNYKKKELKELRIVSEAFGTISNAPTFEFVAFNICSLYLIFVNLINMHLGVFNIMFILFGWMNLEPIIQREVSQKERNNYCIVMHIYMGSWEMVLMNLFAEQLWRHRHWEQTHGHRWAGKQERVGGRESNTETYFTICKADRQCEFAVCLRTQTGLSNNLEG